MDLPEAGAALARWLTLTGTVLAVGVASYRVWVHPRAFAGPAGGDPRAEAALRRSATVGLASGFALLPGLVLIFVFQALAFRDPFAPLGPQLQLLLTRTVWGWAWLYFTAAALVATAMFFWLRRRDGVGGALPSFALVLALAVGPALSGHSVGVEELTVLAVAADAVHVLAGGAWLGTLAVIVAVGVTLPAQGEGPGRAATLAALVGAFSPLALVSAAAVATTGLFASWLHLGALAELWTTPYGRLLALKLGLVALVALAGAYNWKRVTPRLVSGEGADAFLRGSAAVELGIGLLVVVVTAVLVGTALPMEM